MAVESFTFQELNSVEEMIPYLNLIQEMYPDMTLELYKEYLVSMVQNSYYQVVVFENESPVALSGYWINTKLFSGKYIELDNVIVSNQHRSKGIGKLLSDWLLEKGKSLGCKLAVLDAYVENFGAHKFYYREGYVARGYHFVYPLDGNLPHMN